MKMILKKWKIGIGSLLLLLSIACAGGWEEDFWYYSFFAPEVTNNSMHVPFYYSSHWLYPENKESNIYDFNAINQKDWATFFEQKIDNADLKFILYQCRLGELDTLIFYLKNKNYPIKNYLKNNSIYAADAAKAKDFLYYIGYAKRCEPFVAKEYNYWEDEDAKKEEEKNAINTLINNGKKVADNSQYDFVKQRYHFQILRLLFQAENYNACAAYYLEKSPILNNQKLSETIMYRCIGYIAGCSYKNKNYANANYLYAMLFSKCEAMQTTAMNSYHPVENKDFQQLLAQAKTAKEKENVWLMQGYYADESDAIQQIYAINPSSDYLDLLLVRLVNKAEDNVTTETIEEDKEALKKRAENKQYLASRIKLVSKIATENKIAKPALWQMSLGFLYQLNDEINLANDCFAKTKKLTNDQLILDQVKLLEIISYLAATKKPDDAFEKKIVADYNWIETLKQPLRTEAPKRWIINQLAKLYQTNNQPFVAECLVSDKNKFYATEANFFGMLNLMQKKSPTTMEAFALNKYDIQESDLYNFLGTKSFYQNDLANAEKYFALANDTNTLPGDPFLIHIKDCHDCDHEAPQKQKYSALLFTKTIKKIQDNLQTTKDKYPLYLALANAAYNVSYYGNSRAMYYNNVIDMENDYIFWRDESDSKYVQEENKRYRPVNVYDNSAALAYYQKAIESTTDIEQKAFATFMAAKCEQNQFFTTGDSEYTCVAKECDFIAGKYFRELKSKYAKTNFNKEIIKECSYYQTFYNKK